MIRGTRVQVISSDDLDEVGFAPLSDFVTTECAPGVDVGFTVEVPPMGMNVDQSDVDRWDVDRELAADIVDIFGTINPKSLLLGVPGFVLRNSELSTEELPGYSDLPEDWEEDDPPNNSLANWLD